MSGESFFAFTPCHPRCSMVPHLPCHSPGMWNGWQSLCTQDFSAALAPKCCQKHTRAAQRPWLRPLLNLRGFSCLPSICCSLFLCFWPWNLFSPLKTSLFANMCLREVLLFKQASVVHAQLCMGNIYIQMCVILQVARKAPQSWLLTSQKTLISAKTDVSCLPSDAVSNKLWTHHWFFLLLLLCKKYKQQSSYW